MNLKHFDTFFFSSEEQINFWNMGPVAFCFKGQWSPYSIQVSWEVSHATFPDTSALTCNMKTEKQKYTLWHMLPY